MISLIFLLSICLATDPLDHWIDQHASILKQDIKSIAFELKTKTANYNPKNDSIILGKIIIGKNRKFRFEMGPRTVISDGLVWKSYDERTDQIFIQKPDKYLEKDLFSWSKLKKIKTLPVKLEPDDGYRITLPGKKNDLRVYFNSISNEIESIIIINGDIKLEISKIKLSIENTLNLDIGNNNSDSFDLR